MSRFGALGKLGGRKGEKAQADAPAESTASEQGLGGSLTRASDLIDEVVRAAERAAEQIAGDAEARDDGRASVIDRERVAAELMKSLAERTDRLRAEAQELARILDRAAPLVGQADAGAPASPTAPAASTEQAPPPSPSPPPAVPPTAAQPAQAEPVTGASGVSVPPPSGPSASAQAAPSAATDTPQEPVEPPTSFHPAAPAATTAFEPATATAVAQEEPEPPSHAPLEPLGRSGRKNSPHPSEGIRLLATQMAIAGSSHHQIEERLRQEFGVSDADEIIAEVFGARE